MHPMRDPLHPSPARTIHLADYCAPAWQIPEVELRFELDATDTLVHATLQLRRDHDQSTSGHALRLQGEELETLAIAIDGTALPPQAWRIENNVLCLEGLPAQCELRTTVRIHPASNTQLMGLYASGNSEAPGLFTQCEAEGFRRITWFLDRPDVMSRYRVTLEAQRERFPVLLGNGNRVAEGSLPDGRHWARWEDPFPKPCYLFALVAGKLDLLQDHYTTASGRDVTLSIYVDPGKLDQCGFAMQALKKSMRWDEQVFGLELDLDGYIIVAVGDFNMGAMENKGLNIFNTKYVLARPDTATDIDYQNVDRVVAHEYFHNWTGNRVTCRDWFQLSLKEGLTVFRDQEFGADMYSRAVQRIQEVRGLRAAQFPEDAGPMAHPVRPQSYQEISNFYTAKVYE
jgi:aminopeptidase N